MVEGAEVKPAKQNVNDSALNHIKCHRCQEYEGCTEPRDEYVLENDSDADDEDYPDEGRHLFCLVHWIFHIP